MTAPSVATRNGTSEEEAAAEQLRALLGRFDLSRFTYTNTVVIDETAPISHSHPVLTLRPDHILGQAEDRTLTTYLHEQMHWAANTLTGFRAAIGEAEERWPDPPSHTDGGAVDNRSTWLHFPVCALELSAMTAVVGEERAVATAAAVPWYQWIYGRLLGPDLPWRDYLARHHLDLPDEPPRHAIDVAWVLGADVDTLRAAVGDLPQVLADAPLEPDLKVRIIALCCLTLDGHDPASAAALDPRNAELYPVLEARREEVARALARLLPLRG